MMAIRVANAIRLSDYIDMKVLPKLGSAKGLTLFGYVSVWWLYLLIESLCFHSVLTPNNSHDCQITLKEFHLLLCKRPPSLPNQLTVNAQQKDR